MLKVIKINQECLLVTDKVDFTVKNIFRDEKGLSQ